MSAVVADTHAIVWYLTEPSLLSPAALTAIDNATATGLPIYFSAITLVEIRYLVEKGKLDEAVYDRIFQSVTDPTSALEMAPLSLDVVEAMKQIPRTVVADMPDRIIAATALALNLPLVSRDRKIQVSPVVTVW